MSTTADLIRERRDEAAGDLIDAGAQGRAGSLLEPSRHTLPPKRETRQDLGLGSLLSDGNDVYAFAADLLRPTAYQAMLQEYWFKPVEFIEDFFPRFHFTKYQKEVVRQIISRKKVCVRGPHGLGKTAMVACVVLWFALTREDMCKAQGGDWKVVTTASVERQLTKYLWPEIRKWSKEKAMDWQRLGREPFNRRDEMLQTQLKLANGEAFAASSDDPANIEGAHADHLLYIVDEGKSVIPETYDAIEGAFSAAGEDQARAAAERGEAAIEAYAFVISTPGEPSGRFYEIQARRPGYEDWWVRFVTLAEAIAAGRISKDWADKRRRQWGEASAMFQNRVLGQFAMDALDGVIPIHWVEAAMLRGQPEGDNAVTASMNLSEEVLRRLVDQPISCVACDVARSGTDNTILATRYRNVILPLEAWHGADTMLTSGNVVQAGRANGREGRQCYYVVDVVGVGAGVVDSLREQGFDVEAYNGGSTGLIFTDESEELEFVNRRAASWWGMRQLLDPALAESRLMSGIEEIILPYDEELMGDLCTPRYGRTKQGKIQVEEKDAIRKRLGRSPDRGDAVVMACSDRVPIPYEGIAVYDQHVQISPY